MKSIDQYLSATLPMPVTEDNGSRENLKNFKEEFRSHFNQEEPDEAHIQENNRKSQENRATQEKEFSPLSERKDLDESHQEGTFTFERSEKKELSREELLQELEEGSWYIDNMKVRSNHEEVDDSHEIKELIEQGSYLGSLNKEEVMKANMDKIMQDEEKDSELSDSLEEISSLNNQKAPEPSSSSYIEEDFSPECSKKSSSKLKESEQLANDLTDLEINAYLMLQKISPEVLETPETVTEEQILSIQTESQGSTTSQVATEKVDTLEILKSSDLKKLEESAEAAATEPRNSQVLFSIEPPSLKPSSEKIASTPLLALKELDATFLEVEEFPQETRPTDSTPVVTPKNEEYVISDQNKEVPQLNQTSSLANSFEDSKEDSMSQNQKDAGVESHIKLKKENESFDSFDAEKEAMASTSSMKTEAFAPTKEIPLPIETNQRPINFETEANPIKVSDEFRAMAKNTMMELQKQLHARHEISNNKEIKLYLKPEFLGDMIIQFQTEDQGLIANISVQNDTAKELLQLTAKELYDGLRSKGVETAEIRIGLEKDGEKRFTFSDKESKSQTQKEEMEIKRQFIAASALRQLNEEGNKAKITL